MKSSYSIFFLLLVLTGCASTKKRKLARQLTPSLESPIFKNQFTGFFLIDATSKDTLYNYNGEKYFTPASNTKIATLYTALSLLPKRLPTLVHTNANDTTYIKGTGDPSLLHPHFKDSTALLFLKDQRHIAFYPNNSGSKRYGPGWAWDDYDYGYQVEKSAFPLYGNTVRIYKTDSLQVTPTYFRDSVLELNFRQRRKEYQNLFFYNRDQGDTIDIPFRVSAKTTRQLLEMASGKPILHTDKFPEGVRDTLYSVISDSVYRRMMVESDNFLAEQLLLMASATLSDTLNGSTAQKFMLENQLSDLQQSPRWVDGSGLSRYNLFSPQSIVHILYKLYQEYPTERLFQLFPAGGVSGTLEDRYAGASAPYVFAKSGSLGNNYCLSGYLRTESDRILIFSFMNNHFMLPSSEIKTKMESLLAQIRDMDL